MKQKVEGISLLVALGASLLVLAMGIGIITSVEKSHQRSIDIENSIQFFYGSESAIEAALFHKKARGKGAHFVDDTSPSQKLDFYYDKISGDYSMQTKWRLQGRAGTSGNTIVGMLKEGEAVELPLFWDNAVTPDIDPSNIDFGTGDSFKLKFYTLTSQLDGSTDISDKGTDQYRFVEKFGSIENKINFDTTDENSIVIDWDIGRIHPGVAAQTFAVAENSERKYCTGSSETDPDPAAKPAQKTHNFCESDFNNDNLTLASSGLVKGKVNHRLKDTSLGEYWILKDFLDFGSTYTNYQLSLNSGLIQYVRGDQTKFRGIPYTIETTGKEVPTPYYQIVAEVDNVNKFNQRLEIELKEAVANKNFRYVIFD